MRSLQRQRVFLEDVAKGIRLPGFVLLTRSRPRKYPFVATRTSYGWPANLHSRLRYPRAHGRSRPTGANRPSISDLHSVPVGFLIGQSVAFSEHPRPAPHLTSTIA